jgi:hypothetical protein
MLVPAGAQLTDPPATSSVHRPSRPPRHAGERVQLWRRQPPRSSNSLYSRSWSSESSRPTNASAPHSAGMERTLHAQIWAAPCARQVSGAAAEGAYPQDWWRHSWVIPSSHRGPRGCTVTTDCSRSVQRSNQSQTGSCLQQPIPMEWETSGADPSMVTVAQGYAAGNREASLLGIAHPQLAQRPGKHLCPFHQT